MAAIERLTAKAVQAAIKAVVLAGKPKTIGDGGGLVLEVQPSKPGWWRLRYSFGGRENRLRLAATTLKCR